MNKHVYLFWPVVFITFVIWTARVLYLPMASDDSGLSAILLQLFSALVLLGPFVLASLLLFRAPLKEVFALKFPSRLGMLIGAVYALSMFFNEASIRILHLTPNPWVYLMLPITAIAEELVFRGFIFTYLLHAIGRFQAVLITTVLATMLYMPKAIFIDGLQGELFIAFISQIFVFSLIQGIIRYYSKSVYPTIVTNIMRNLMLVI